MAPSPSPSGSALPAGWTRYTDNQRGYSAAIAPEWSSRYGLPSCPGFATNPTFGNPVPEELKPTDEGFSLCAGTATGCNTPQENDTYTPIVVAGISTNESHHIDGGNGYLPANGLCYELHLDFMPGVSRQRIDYVRGVVWPSFKVFPPGSATPTAVRSHGPPPV